MLANIIKVAFRNLFKYPGYSLLNMGGLALGLASSFLLLLYAQRELTVDRHFQNADRIHRIATDFFNMGGFAVSQEALYEYLITECKDVEAATRFNRAYQEQEVTVGNNSYLESFGLYYIDSSFFDVFSYPFVEGNSTKRYLGPDEVILTKKTAEKYFGDLPAWGKTITVGKEKKDYQVVGVVQARNENSHLKPDMFFSNYSLLKNDRSWSSAAVYNYVRLSENASVKGLEESLEKIRKSYIYPSAGFAGSYEEWRQSNQAVHFFIQPLPDIYLYSKYNFEVTAGGNPQQVYILGIVGLVIILIAGVNYINLTTARSSVRSKEVGVKKALGAGRRNLVLQFLTESVGFSLLAMFAGVVFLELLLIVFERISGQSLMGSLIFSGRYLAAFAGFAVLTGVLAGLYPSFYLSAFRPARILRGAFSPKGNKLIRGSLVVFQFAVAIALMIASWVVFQQLKFLQNKNLGFEKEGVLVVENLPALQENIQPFKELLAQRSEVVTMSLNNRTPAGKSIWMYTYQTKEMDQEKTIQTFPVDENYITALGMQLIAGRNFSRQMDSDTTTAIINETAARELGLHAPLDAEINPGMRVIGVVRDFHYESLRNGITPVVLRYSPHGGSLAVKLKGADLSAFMDELQAIWKRFSPDAPLHYSFLDESFAQLLEKEKILGRAVAFFTLLAIIISCLGLFALAVFTAESRTKEIGIRKVLGAGIGRIVALLSRDFIKLVLVAACLGLPIAWLAMNRWLEDFAFRIEIQWWMLVLPCMTALAVALLTVSSQAVKAAMADPVKSLRDQ